MKALTPAGYTGNAADQARDIETPRRARTLPGGMEATEFLARYWQREPLLLRNALRGWRNPLEPEELAGLACEAEVESRLISGTWPNGKWRLRHGPFNDRDFAACRRKTGHYWSRAWTVVPEVEDLRRRFRFVPDWRLDDVMVSYAAPVAASAPCRPIRRFPAAGAGATPLATRIARQRQSAVHPGIEVQVLAAFEAEQEYTLSPGDMLYLPLAGPTTGWR